MKLFTLLLLASAAAAQQTAVPSPAAEGSAEPFLSATRNGVLLSWLEPVKPPNIALRFSRYRDGAWSRAQTVVERADLFVNWADFPSIVEDAKGVLYAHWLQKSGTSTYAYDVWMSTSRDGGTTWRKPFVINTDGTKTEHGFVTLAPLPKSGVAVTWLDGRNMPEGKEEGDMTIRYAVVDANGTVRAGAELDRRTCECCTTGMTVAATGPVVVYRDRSPEEIRDIAAVRRTARGWSKPAIVHPDGWKIQGCPVNGPQIDSAGKVVAAAWFTAAQDRGRAYVAFSTDGGATFAKPVQIDDGRPVGRVDVVMHDATSAIVTWVEQTSAGAEIRARRVNAGGAQPSVKIADSSTARAAGFPRVARAGSETFFAWTEQTATTKRIHIAKRHF